MKKFSKFAAKACCFALAASACVAPSISNIAPSFAINASAASVPLYDTMVLDKTMAFGNRANAWSDCAAVLVFNGAELELVTDGYGIDNHAYEISKSALAHDKYREVVVTLEDDGHAIIHFLKFDQSQYGFVEYFSYSYDEASSDDVQLSIGTAFDDECVSPSIVTAPGHEGFKLYETSAFANGLFDFSMRHEMCAKLQWLPHDVIDNLVEYRRNCDSEGYDSQKVASIINSSSHTCDPILKMTFDYDTMGYSVYALFGNEPVFIDAAGERSYGSLKNRILVPSNARPGSSLDVEGTDMDGNFRHFTLDVRDDLDSPLLPLGIMKTATVRYTPQYGGSSNTVFDTIIDGKPSNGKYVETQLRTTGGDYAIKDAKDKILKRGNVLTDGWLTFGGTGEKEGYENMSCTTSNVEFFDGSGKSVPGKLTALGATAAQVRGILNSGTKWLEVAYKPLYMTNTDYAESTRKNELVESDDLYQITAHDHCRLILLLDAHGNYMPYSVSDTLGDINDDKQFSVDDYYVLKQYLKGTPVSKLGVSQMDVTINGDVNKDGKVDESDLKAMQREIKKHGLA